MTIKFEIDKLVFSNKLAKLLRLENVCKFGQL